MAIVGVVCGLCAGLIGASPFLLLGKVMRSHAALRGIGMIPAGFLSTFVSFFIMAVALFACSRLAPGQIVVFAAVCIMVFLLATCLFAWRMGRAPGGIAGTSPTRGEDRS